MSVEKEQGLVYPDDLHFPQFRQLFLKALAPFGVTEIGTFSACLIIKADEPHCMPVRLMCFTLHTNVGIQKYSVSIPHTKTVNAFLPEDKEWNHLFIHLDLETKVLTVKFAEEDKDAVKSEIVLFPAA